MIRVDLIIKALQGNFSQVLLGLMLLDRRKLIDLHIHVDHAMVIQGCHVYAIVNKRKQIFFDTDDSSNINTAELEKCDLYAKRMLLKTDSQKNGKLIPLGLNYIMDTNSMSFLVALIKARKVRLVKREAPLFFNWMSWFTGRDYAMAPVPYKKFYHPPQVREKPVINFYTRLMNYPEAEPQSIERHNVISFRCKHRGIRPL